MFVLNQLFILSSFIHSGVYFVTFICQLLLLLLSLMSLLFVHRPPKNQPGHTQPLPPQPPYFTYLILDEGPSGICFIQCQQVGVTDQHGREWEGLGKVVAAAGTPKLPREVSPPSPTLGCDLLQHEVIEVLLGDGALDTERTVTLLLPCSLQVIIFSFLIFFSFFFLSIAISFFSLCACLFF